MFKQKSKTYSDHGRTYRMTVTYGLDYEFALKNNQAPYFSLTSMIEEKLRNGRWRDEGGGANHEEIIKRFPELVPLVKWHLTGTNGPMHYIENARYFWEQWQGISKWERRPYDPDPLEALKRTILWGAVLGDESVELDNFSMLFGSHLNEESQGQGYLWDRLPALLASFEADMREISVWED